MSNPMTERAIERVCSEVSHFTRSQAIDYILAANRANLICLDCGSENHTRGDSLCNYPTAETLAQRLTEVCEGYGLPVNVDALVRHLEGNAGMTGYLDGMNDTTQGLTHVGWQHVVDGEGYALCRVNARMPFDRYKYCPVFTHEDWLDKVPASADEDSS